MSGSIVAIQTCPGHHLPMRPLEDAELVRGGIQGDTHFAPRSSRQVLMIDMETLDERGLVAGQVKENLTVAGIGVMALPRGTRLEVGTAELEVTKPCDPCSRMDEIRPGLRTELMGRRGMFARVTRAGTVTRGDAVRILAPPRVPS